jgi:hypothetical protein
VDDEASARSSVRVSLLQKWGTQEHDRAPLLEKLRT